MIKKTKIFIASSPLAPNNNLSVFYNDLKSNESIDLLHPTTVEDIENINSVEVLDYELAKTDKLKILESSIVIIDLDAEIKKAYLYWSCVNPNTNIIIVSKICPSIDTFVSEKVVAVVKPQFLLTTVCSILSLDKQDLVHEQE